MVIAMSAVLGMVSCRKDITPLPQHSYFAGIDTSKRVDSTVADSAGKAADSTVVDSAIRKAPDNQANNVIETAAPVHTAVTMNVNGNVAGFWQSVPARYASTTKKYPLIIFIHGIGELGTNLARLNCCGLPKHLNTKSFPADFNVKGNHYSFIVMSPQFKRRPSAAEIQSVIDFAKRRFRVDATRIYVTGLSMGGGSTWDYAAVYGQQAAAIVPVCGGTRPSAAMAKSIASKNVPVWTLHSTGDRSVPVQWASDWISWIDKDNPSLAAFTKLTVWPSIDHNATWAKAFNPATRIDGMNIYEWMLQYDRG